MTQELKPCPFCGAEAKLHKVARDWWRIIAHHEEDCIVADCHAPTAPQTPDQAELLVAAWNRRAPVIAETANCATCGAVGSVTSTKARCTLCGMFADTAGAKPRRTLNFARYEAFEEADRKVQKEIDACKTLMGESVASPAIEVPQGAIVNGAAYADRLERDYNFQCDAGPLNLCSDYVEFRRCFDHLAEWASNLPKLYASPAIDAAHWRERCEKAENMIRELEAVVAKDQRKAIDAAGASEEDVPQASITVVVKGLIECLMLWNGQAFAGLDMDVLEGLRDELNSAIAKESGK